MLLLYSWVATVLTVYGIETRRVPEHTTVIYRLQQYLPFTVLKPTENALDKNLLKSTVLQQYLPFTVLKLFNRKDSAKTWIFLWVATVLTVYGIETQVSQLMLLFQQGCNSTYRLRYWNSIAFFHTSTTNWSLQQYLPFTVLKPQLCLRTRHNSL